MLTYHKRLKVTAPSDVGTATLLTVALDDLGLTDENIEGMSPICVQKVDTSGNGKVFDDAVTISGQDLLIAEGSTGFAAGDEWTIDLEVGVPTTEGVDSTP